MATGHPVPVMNATVVPFVRRPNVSPNHPSMHGSTDTAAPATVTLDRLQAELIASLLKSARHLLPSPKAVDAAVEILTGGGS